MPTSQGGPPRRRLAGRRETLPAVRAEADPHGTGLGGARPSSPPRPEYPRPQLSRERWINLNGVWRFAFDDSDRGRSEMWAATSAGAIEAGEGPLHDSIVVPFCPQAPLSGIDDASFHDVAWYGRTFDTPSRRGRDRVVLHCGAIDYRADVWINGALVASHEGGHTPFSADVTNALSTATNTLVVRVEDPGSDPGIPRGKQDWLEQHSHIFYRRTTGIWQTVWLEIVDELHVDSLRLTPNVSAARLDVVVRLVGWQPGTRLRVVAELDGRQAGATSAAAEGAESSVALPLDRVPLRVWSPRDPALYDLRIELLDDAGETRDVVTSYFGMRTIEASGGRVLLNGDPLYLRLVLDQGYWPDGLLTAPSDAALRADIECALEMGFNGARKHQKVEDPRWLYWADRLGFLVWGEMANAHALSPRSIARTTREWIDVVARDFNHPCVIAWVPINESMGCRLLGPDGRRRIGPFAAHYATALYHLTKALDTTRLVLSNDGWEHTHSDLCTVHDYSDPETLTRRLASLDRLLPPISVPPVYAAGFAYGGEPVVLSEFAGIFRAVEVDGFDYAVAVDDLDLDRLAERFVTAALASPILSGFCYTQLTDVDQEQNGLLTADRRPKLPLSRIRSIVAAPANVEARDGGVQAGSTHA
jgi:beta-galactosidase/beta-glucuronidase